MKTHVCERRRKFFNHGSSTLYGHSAHIAIKSRHYKLSRNCLNATGFKQYMKSYFISDIVTNTTDDVVSLLIALYGYSAHIAIKSTHYKLSRNCLNATGFKQYMKSYFISDIVTNTTDDVVSLLIALYGYSVHIEINAYNTLNFSFTFFNALKGIQSKTINSCF